MNMVQECMTACEIRACLSTMPKSIESMYDITMERIQSQVHNRPTLGEFAMSVLGWVVHSGSRMHVECLQHAWAMQKFQRLEADSFFDEFVIPSECYGLVTVSNSVVSLVHYTAKTYLDNNRNKYFPDMADVVAKTCVQYLLLRALEQPDNPLDCISYAEKDRPEINLDETPIEHIVQDGENGRLYPPLSYEAKAQIFCLIPYIRDNLQNHLRAVRNADEILPLVRGGAAKDAVSAASAFIL